MIGDNIKKLRQLKNMTQTQFAERIGIKQNTLASIESGKKNTSRQALLSISREFGVRLEWLETGEGEMYKQGDTSILAQLESDGVLTSKGRELMEIYLRLPPEAQDLIADAIATAAKLYPRKPDDKKSVDEMREETNRELNDVEAARKRGTSTLSASTISSGSSKKFGKST